MKSSHITLTDQFCGCGGSSIGARRLAQRVKGLEVKLALNHWKLAIETHNTNFPNTLHDCTDISACEPRKYPSTTGLITSPECTNHTVSKGIKRVKAQMNLFEKGEQDPSAERSRATMWDVPRFAEYHNYEFIIVENVVDARSWVMYDAWIHAMDLLGYTHKCVYANSMFFYPTPQSRDRMYVVFTKKNNPSPDLDHKPLAHCPKCEKNINAIQRWKMQRCFGKYKTQYNYCCPVCGTIVAPYYYAAFNCIDWSDKGERIGDRKKALADNTERRIRYGLDKYPESGFVINDQQSTGIDFRVKSLLNVTPVISTSPNLKVVFPFITMAEHSKNNNVRSTLEAIQTQTTTQSMGIVTPPFIIEMKGQSNSKEITDPLSCLTTHQYHGLVTTEKWNSFIGYYYGNNQYSQPHEPIGSCTTKDRHFLVNYEKPVYEDCYFRMVNPKEVKSAMAFDEDYIVLGTGAEQVKQCGNAVTPPVMEWLLERCIKTLN